MSLSSMIKADQETLGKAVLDVLRSQDPARDIYSFVDSLISIKRDDAVSALVKVLKYLSKNANDEEFRNFYGYVLTSISDSSEDVVSRFMEILMDAQSYLDQDAQIKESNALNNALMVLPKETSKRIMSKLQ
ncbi:hypothetical protein [Sulfuracidifex tepidarius]|uniref:Uncharacterized protein n=1 Tax=Sulfuracidifex tepidarius TaxID=1294262 RepID=A0A510E677_9CREN|nr:hypothetical protein [Sulfuracidifex tepidarius]BBG24749.1 hypothetical protein IC006_2083 [Sulfuracidifex tepidarius]BBG27538.1 hypothetical protein IC007_2092 [Sulfuracidifex tepidarius]